MIDTEYLKSSKEQIKEMIELLKHLNEASFNNLIFHMQKAMLLMVDSIMGRHTDLLTEYPEIKEKASKFFGNDFFENYFLLSNMSKKKIKMLSNDKIIIMGKKPYNLDKNYFNEMASLIINYFNKIYSRVEENGF